MLAPRRKQVRSDDPLVALHSSQAYLNERSVARNTVASGRVGMIVLRVIVRAARRAGLVAPMSRPNRMVAPLMPVTWPVWLPHARANDAISRQGPQLLTTGSTRKAY